MNTSRLLTEENTSVCSIICPNQVPYFVGRKELCDLSIWYPVGCFGGTCNVELGFPSMRRYYLALDILTLTGTHTIHVDE